MEIGDLVTLKAERVVHGGHVLSHFEGNTIFIRGAIPHEIVSARITRRRKRVFFADVTEVFVKSPYRVNPPCEFSTNCGGCDFQYVDISHQRSFKTHVLQESCERFARLTVEEFEQLLPAGVQSLAPANGLHWRSRIRLQWSNGWAMRAKKSHDAVPINECVIASEEINHQMQVMAHRSLESKSPEDELIEGEYIFSEGESGVSVRGPHGFRLGQERTKITIGGFLWQMRPTAFWQAHPQLIGAISETLDSALPIKENQHWWDLYGGAGVFAAYLHNRMKGTGKVTLVESGAASIEAARNAFVAPDSVKIIESTVEEFLRVAPKGLHSPHGAIVDPPRSGIGSAVCHLLADHGVPVIAYIACDPVSLARDIKTLRDLGYQLKALESWDAFPMTHHFESLAVLAHDAHLS